jgi:hypothetical protein
MAGEPERLKTLYPSDTARQEDTRRYPLKENQLF